MRIGIEGKYLFQKNKDRLDYDIIDTIRELVKLDRSNLYFIFVFKGDDKINIESENLTYVELPRSTGLLWDQVTLPKAVDKLNIDIVHCTKSTVPIFCKAKSIVTYHSRKYQENLNINISKLSYNLLKPLTLRKADHIISYPIYSDDGEISTKYRSITTDLSNCTVAPNFKKITDRSKLEAVADKYQLPDNYILLSTEFSTDRDIEKIVRSYIIYTMNSPKSHSLVIIGKSKSYLDKMLNKRVGESWAAHKMISILEIDYKDLTPIYNLASLVIYMPTGADSPCILLESFACGTPVMSNYKSSNRAIMESIISISNNRPKIISNKLCAIHTDTDKMKKLVTNGLDLITEKTRAEHAKEIIEIYNK